MRWWRLVGRRRRLGEAVGARWGRSARRRRGRCEKARWWRCVMWW